MFAKPEGANHALDTALGYRNPHPHHHYFVADHRARLIVSRSNKRLSNKRTLAP
jgi:hypothetical protein